MADEGYAFPVVGIGASAGGISALEEFFKGMPEVGLELRAAVREAVATRSRVTHESLLVNDVDETLFHIFLRQPVAVNESGACQ